MDPKLVYWTAALLNLGVLCAFALMGVRHARRGEFARHERAMKIAGALVLAFLFSYVGKLYFIGREDMSVWSTFDTWVLRIHETFVLAMVVGGIVAFVQARKLRPTRLMTRNPEDPAPNPKTARIHRIAGRTSVVGAVLGFVFAIGILVGMFARVAV